MAARAPRLGDPLPALVAGTEGGVVGMSGGDAGPSDDTIEASEQRRAQDAEIQARIIAILDRLEDDEALVRRMVIDIAQLYRERTDWLAKCDDCALPVLVAGLEQVARGTGLTADDPLEDVGVSGSHAVIRALGFAVIRQHASRSEDGLWFLDTLWCEDDHGTELVIFSRVPTGRMEMLLEACTPVGLAP